MKFVHIADMHFDAPFTFLSQKKDLGDLRRVEQRQVLKKIIQYIKENNIKYFFISGDLYEHEYIRKSTIEFIDNCFKEIPDTNIFISPGNHDPFIKNSYYNQYNWSKNVHIFRSQIERIEMPEADIYGFGFNDFTCNRVNIENINIENKEKLNLLIIHGSLDSSDKLQMQYNPIMTSVLKQKRFDYVALGHIHKTNYSENTKFVYPGSTMSLGFDELGEHGMIIGDVEKNKLNLEFKKLDDRKFVEKEIDITNINSKEDLIQIINEQVLEEQNMYKIILIGKRNFEINVNDIEKSVLLDNIIKIKNKTKMNYNLEELAKEKSLKGIFVKKMLEKLNSGSYEQEEIEKAIEIVLDVLY